MALTKERIEEIIEGGGDEVVGIYYDDGKPAVLYCGELTESLSDINRTLNEANNEARWQGECQYFMAAQDEWNRRYDEPWPGHTYTSLLTKGGVLSVDAILATHIGDNLLDEHGRVNPEFRVPPHLIDVTHTLKYRFCSHVDHSICSGDECKNITPDDKLVNGFCPACQEVRRTTYKEENFDEDDSEDMEELSKLFPDKYLERMWKNDWVVNLLWVMPGDHGWTHIKRFSKPRSSVAFQARDELDGHLYGYGYLLESIVGEHDDGETSLYVRWDPSTLLRWDPSKRAVPDASVSEVALNVIRDNEDLSEHFQ